MGRPKKDKPKFKYLCPKCKEYYTKDDLRARYCPKCQQNG